MRLHTIVTSGLLALGLSASAPAFAKQGAKVLSGMPVRVAIEGRLERAIGLQSLAGEWQLHTSRTEITRAELVDETARTHEKWVLVPEGDALRLDAERFVPTHSYRVELYAGTRLVEQGVVYLYAPRRGVTRRVTFDPSHEVVEADGMMGVLPKSAL